VKVMVAPATREPAAVKEPETSSMSGTGSPDWLVAGEIDKVRVDGVGDVDGDELVNPEEPELGLMVFDEV
jgi:hypothetical protein